MNHAELDATIDNATFAASDKAMLTVEKQYQQLESIFNDRVQNVQRDNPGYHSYIYQTEPIGHDPYVLISILSAIKPDFQAFDEPIQQMIAQLSSNGRQYTFKTTPALAAQYANRHHGEPIDSIPRGHLDLNVFLSNYDMQCVIDSVLTREQLKRYAAYMRDLGGRPDLFPIEEYPYASQPIQPYRYQVPPEVLAKYPILQQELAVAEPFIGYPYVWSGDSPETSFDCSGFVCHILNHIGLTVPRLTAQGIYDKLTPVSIDQAHPGDLVFFDGTFNTENNRLTHVGIYVGDNTMLHCGAPAIQYWSLSQNRYRKDKPYHIASFARIAGATLAKAKLYPPALTTGDAVGLVAPASMISSAKLNQVVELVKRLGFRPMVARQLAWSVKAYDALQNDTIDQFRSQQAPDYYSDIDCYVKAGYAAGSPIHRADDINRLFADDNVKAIWCLRGGYSSAQVMSYLDYSLIQSHPKIILGYSDITNIINGIYRQTGLVTYHAPMVTPNFLRDDLLDNGQPDEYTLSNFERFIMSDWQEVNLVNPPSRPIETLVSGQAEGEIVGGNLITLARACGTPYLPDMTDKILFIEEVTTHVPFIDMALTELQNSGIFSQIRGLILGDFIKCRNQTGEGKAADFTAERLLDARLSSAKFPIVKHVAIGHGKQTMTIPIGSYCRLDATARTITIRR